MMLSVFAVPFAAVILLIKDYLVLSKDMVLKYDFCDVKIIHVST